jgi:hypothetical protein
LPVRRLQLDQTALSCITEGCECQAWVASDLARVRITLRVAAGVLVIDAEECSV